MERRKPLQRKPNLLLGEQRRENSCLLESNQLFNSCGSEASNLRIIPRAWTLILHTHQVNRRKRRARESALPTNFEQSKEKNYPPTSLVTLLCIFCVLGRAHSCALCAPSGRRGESRRAGDGNPALLLLCSNWPQQPAAASRSDFLVPKGNAIKKFKILSHYYLYSRKQERRLLLPLFLLLVKHFLEFA